jgi:alpha-beta hydrolase superfamily lysophospholipase
MNSPSIHRWLAALALACPSIAAGNVSAATPAERIVDLPLHDGARQRLLYDTPPNPKATIVALPGGAGDVGIQRNGDLRHDDNFVVRTRELWTSRGFAVLIPDALDHDNLRGMRRSPAYAALIGDLVQFAHQQSAAPVFLLGTSQGSIAAMNGAAHLTPTQLAGVVLTESVSVLGGSHETVFQADPQHVRVPALVVANRSDRCDVAPPGNAPRIAAAMSASPSVKVIEVSGGIQHSSNACGSLTPHGYYGIETQVVDAIAAWMQQQLAH